MFASRKEAGYLLAKELVKEALGRVVVLGIPQGGVFITPKVASVL